MKIEELFKLQHRQERRERRKLFVHSHLFDIINCALSILALVIALLGLILPRG